MSTEEYQARMAGLGIGRGALADQFDDAPATLPDRLPNLINERASVRVRAATLGLPAEDLAHLNPACSASIARQVSARARRRRAANGKSGAPSPVSSPQGEDAGSGRSRA